MFMMNVPYECIMLFKQFQSSKNEIYSLNFATNTATNTAIHPVVYTAIHTGDYIAVHTAIYTGNDIYV